MITMMLNACSQVFLPIAKIKNMVTKLRKKLNNIVGLDKRSAGPGYGTVLK